MHDNIQNNPSSQNINLIRGISPSYLGTFYSCIQESLIGYYLLPQCIFIIILRSFLTASKSTSTQGTCTKGNMKSNCSEKSKMEKGKISKHQRKLKRTTEIQYLKCHLIHTLNENTDKIPVLDIFWRKRKGKKT